MGRAGKGVPFAGAQPTCTASKADEGSCSALAPIFLELMTSTPQRMTNTPIGKTMNCGERDQKGEGGQACSGDARPSGEIRPQSARAPARW